MVEDPRCQVLICGFVALFRELGLLVGMGCEAGQGWLFGRSVPEGKLPWSTEGPIP